MPSKNSKGFEMGLGCPRQYWERFETFASKLRKVWDAHNKSRESRQAWETRDNVKNGLRRDWGVCNRIKTRLRRVWEKVYLTNILKLFKIRACKFLCLTSWNCERSGTFRRLRRTPSSSLSPVRSRTFVLPKAALCSITTLVFMFLYSVV